jgi:hypothetical protein
MALGDLFVPQLISAFLKQAGWGKTANTLVVLLVYIAWTLFSTYTGMRGDLAGQTLQFQLEKLVPAFAAALGVGYASYMILWKNLLGEDMLSLKTSIVKGPETDPVDPEDDDEVVTDDKFTGES